MCILSKITYEDFMLHFLFLICIFCIIHLNYYYLLLSHTNKEFCTYVILVLWCVRSFVIVIRCDDTFVRFCGDNAETNLKNKTRIMKTNPSSRSPLFYPPLNPTTRTLSPSPPYFLSRKFMSPN